MIAKLFDQISVHSLFYASFTALVILGAGFWLPRAEVSFLWIEDTYVLPANFSWPLALVATLISGLTFNEVNNRQRLFAGQYHVLPVFTALAFIIFSGSLQIKGYLSLLLLLFFVLKTYRLIYEKDTKYLYFETGLIAGLLCFWYADYLVLLPMGWVAGLILGKLSARALVASLLGAIAMIYFPIAVGGFFGANLFTVLENNLQNFALGVDFSRLKEVYIAPLILLLLIVFFQFPGLQARATNQQRQAISFWYVLLVFALAGYLIFENKIFYSALLIFPFSRLLGLFISNNQNRWLRNSIYFLLLGSVVLVVLSGRNFLI